jgi:hypothetical protein
MASWRAANETDARGPEDLEIRCPDGTLYAHCRVVAAGSQLLHMHVRIAGSGPFQIRVEESAAAMGPFIRSLYPGMVPEVGWDSVEQLLQLAFKYAAPALRRACQAFLESSAAHGWEPEVQCQNEMGHQLPLPMGPLHEEQRLYPASNSGGAHALAATQLASTMCLPVAFVGIGGRRCRSIKLHQSSHLT